MKWQCYIAVEMLSCNKLIVDRFVKHVWINQYEILVIKAFTPVFQLVLMIQPLKVHHVPLIYRRQVNFVMFSFKTAIWKKKNEMTKTCKYYPWQVLQLTFTPHTVKTCFGI